MDLLRPRRARGIVDEAVVFILGFIIVVLLLTSIFVRQRAESPTLLVGPGATVTKTEKSEGWGFGIGTLLTVGLIIGGIIVAKRQR
ncbi:MAG TPA: hypothetical protein VGP72_03775 [Planctomycetota bacterium]|jgi:hypothetical protein